MALAHGGCETAGAVVVVINRCRGGDEWCLDRDADMQMKQNKEEV